jgi:hypothetical protein
MAHSKQKKRGKKSIGDILRKRRQSGGKDTTNIMVGKELVLLDDENASQISLRDRVIFTTNYAPSEGFTINNTRVPLEKCKKIFKETFGGDKKLTIDHPYLPCSNSDSGVASGVIMNGLKFRFKTIAEEISALKDLPNAFLITKISHLESLRELINASSVSKKCYDYVNNSQSDKVAITLQGAEWESTLRAFAAVYLIAKDNETSRDMSNTGISMDRGTAASIINTLRKHPVEQEVLKKFSDTWDDTEGNTAIDMDAMIECLKRIKEGPGGAAVRNKTISQIFQDIKELINRHAQAVDKIKKIEEGREKTKEEWQSKGSGEVPKETDAAYTDEIKSKTLESKEIHAELKKYIDLLKDIVDNVSESLKTKLIEEMQKAVIARVERDKSDDFTRAYNVYRAYRYAYSQLVDSYPFVTDNDGTETVYYVPNSIAQASGTIRQSVYDFDGFLRSIDISVSNTIPGGYDDFIKEMRASCDQKIPEWLNININTADTDDREDIKSISTKIIGSTKIIEQWTALSDEEKKIPKHNAVKGGGSGNTVSSALGASSEQAKRTDKVTKEIDGIISLIRTQESAAIAGLDQLRQLTAVSLSTGGTEEEKLTSAKNLLTGMIDSANIENSPAILASYMIGEINRIAGRLNLTLPNKSEADAAGIKVLQAATDADGLAKGFKPLLNGNDSDAIINAINTLRTALTKVVDATANANKAAGGLLNDIDTSYAKIRVEMLGPTGVAEPVKPDGASAAAAAAEKEAAEAAAAAAVAAAAAEKEAAEAAAAVAAEKKAEEKKTVEKKAKAVSPLKALKARDQGLLHPGILQKQGKDEQFVSFFVEG